jgi:TolB-like protein
VRRALRHVVVVVCLFWLAAASFASADLSLVMRSSRVAVMPFGNLSEAPEASRSVMSLVRQRLEARSVELADSAALMAVLRKYRVRNTTELSATDAQSVAEEVSVRYLLLGSIDRYTETDSSAEVALSARLLDVATSNVVWAGSATEYGDPRVRLLGVGAHHPLTLAQYAADDLLKDFRLGRPQNSPIVQAVRLRGEDPLERPCHKVMLVTFGNESETNFAGNIVANEVLTALLHRGFSLVDPGRVREMMLGSKDLVQGEISRELLVKCGRDLGADFVLTGTVSRFESQRGQLFEEPAVAFEARLIDTKKGDVVWAKMYSRDGKDSAWLFNIGYVHGLADLSRRMCRQLVWDLPVIRSRTLEIAPSSIAEGK